MSDSPKASQHNKTCTIHSSSIVEAAPTPSGTPNEKGTICPMAQKKKVVYSLLRICETSVASHGALRAALLSTKAASSS